MNMEFNSMEDMIRKAIEDASDRQQGVIRFIVRCGSCDEVWYSDPVRFDMAGVAAENENKRIILDARWMRQWESEWRQAAEEAQKHFNLCPICKKISCEKCFRICDTIDMCASCAERLGERGEAVGEKFISAAPEQVPRKEAKPLRGQKKGWQSLWRKKAAAKTDHQSG